MVPCQCELGGKDPLYVADDVADIKSVAVPEQPTGAFYNNGQSCCAVERIYVHEKIYDQYVDEFVKEVKTLQDRFAQRTRSLCWSAYTKLAVGCTPVTSKRSGRY